MKQSSRSTAITELYQQKLLYQTHLRKLQQIRQDRKNQLASTQRISQQHTIKVAKSRSFAYRYNEQYSGIMEENKRFLKRLEKMRGSRQTSFSTCQREERESTLTPFQKQRLAQTEKQNTRIYVRVKSVSSELSKDKLLKDYAKSMQIKNRISRYVNSSNGVCLKSQRSLSVNMGKPESNAKGLVGHYKAGEILSNRIQKPQTALARQRRQALSARGDKDNKDVFFATEPKNSGAGTAKYQRRIKKTVI